MYNSAIRTVFSYGLAPIGATIYAGPFTNFGQVTLYGDIGLGQH